MLLICDSHPVQYRAPLYRELARRLPEGILVLYASDCSVRGYEDTGFGGTVAWDEPLLEGYGNAVLKTEHGSPLSGWGSLTGRGVPAAIARARPAAVMLTGLNYRFDWTAALVARTRGIPLWLRCETQDEAFGARPPWKKAVRSCIYRNVYRMFDRFFFIGELNREHYLRHGVAPSRLRAARYFTVDRVSAAGERERDEARRALRRAAAVEESAIVCGFSGKFTPKKNPQLLFAMLDYLPETLRRHVQLYFVGSGELDGELRRAAVAAKRDFGVNTHFTGFINQSAIGAHYLAMDVLALPSRRMGETWGLVANEAMQAGCSVVASGAAGCHRDFRSWERFRVFPESDARALALAFEDVSRYERSFVWASGALEANYSLRATADTLQQELECLQRGSAQ
jgi:glycosyltransferase involved in cell wall biosynthesis